MGLSLGLMVTPVVVGGLLYLMRKSTARDEVWRLVNTGGLPKDGKLIAAAQQRLVEQQAAFAVGFAGAGVAVAGILSLAATDRFRTVFIWTLMAMVAGGGVGSYLQHFRTVRAARPGGPRAARLQPRRLADYLTRREIVAQYVLLVLPLFAIALGVLALTTADEHAGRGWALVIPAMVAMPFGALGSYLQRRILALNQPASGVDELRWQEALRADALRAMAKIVVGVGWLFGSFAILTFEWPPGVPAYAAPVGWILFLVGLVFQVLISSAVDSSGALRRSQVTFQPRLEDGPA